MKQTIRLSESELRGMIQESVRRALNELDARTYASAAEKARLGHQYGRAAKFKNAAADSWNKEFGGGEAEGWESSFVVPYDWDGREPLGYGETHVRSRRTDMERGNAYLPSNSRFKSDKRLSWTKKDGIEDWHDTTPMTQGEKVASQMVRGNGKYIKGKGWQ